MVRVSDSREYRPVYLIHKSKDHRGDVGGRPVYNDRDNGGLK